MTSVSAALNASNDAPDSGVISGMSSGAAAPFAKTATVSLVLMSPSTEIELNERSTACVKAVWREAGSIAASVAMTPSIVA